MAKEGKLTPKQQLFVSEYLKTGNATEAVKRAGYRFKNDESARVQGAKLLTNATVSRACARAQERRSARLELEEDFELKKALRLLEMCMEPEQVVDGKGEPVVDEKTGKFVMTFDSKGANSALMLISKLRGKLVQKIEVGMADNLAEDLAGVKE